MRSFSACDYLLMWERGSALHAIDRALLMLQMALPEADYQGLVCLPLGQRDRLLIEVRQRSFGDLLEACIECPECSERLVFSLSCAEVLNSAPLPENPAKTVTSEGVSFELRCPDTRDLAEAAGGGDAEIAATRLLARCAKRNRDSTGLIDDITATQKAVIAAALAALDPAAEILLDMHCPACGHGWQALFDISQVLWTEIRARARRVLQEVDALARIYHWSESEILDMSEARRSQYLEMALS